MLNFPYRALLFDLDGTLLQVEMKNFIQRYVGGFHARCADLVSLEALQRTMRAAIHLLLETAGGGATNEARLFAYLAARLDVPETLLRERFSCYLQHDLESLASTVRPIEEVASLLAVVERIGIPLVLATNPVFPLVLIEARCRWVGIDPQRFQYVTSFENSHFCKPQAGYFTEVCAHLGLPTADCLMVGNDSSHDLSATQVGMETYLVDPFLLERDGSRWSPDYRGNHQQLCEFFEQHVGSSG